jgi:two-component sensor histidine kinase
VIPGSKESIERGFVSLIDITERKSSEEIPAAPAAEKELLPKELRHRVKNNLGTISSLLGLEIDIIENSEKGYHQECSGRG